MQNSRIAGFNRVKNRQRSWRLKIETKKCIEIRISGKYPFDGQLREVLLYQC